MASVSSMVDACPCGCLPWLAVLVLLLFATIDDVVIKGEVFL